MAGVRGTKAFRPQSGKPATGIFSTKGRQKNDGTGGMPNQKVMNYSLGSSTRSQPKGGDQGLRHVKHYGKGGTSTKL